MKGFYTRVCFEQARNVANDTRPNFAAKKDSIRK